MMKRLFCISGILFFLPLTLLVGIHIDFQPANAAKSIKVASNVAVLSGVLNDGDTNPHPTYSDGTTADEADCYWVVSTNLTSASYAGIGECFITGQTIVVETC